MATGNEITIVAPHGIDEAQKLSLELGKATLIPDALRNKPADILATILAGAELGLAPMQAIRGIAIIKGKPTLSADTMGALCKRRSDVCEYLTLVESSSQRCIYEAKRRGEPKPTQMSFSMEDAQRAGLSGSDTYRKFPQAMLRARCLAAICRAVFPDLCLGLYDPDELAEHPAPIPVQAEPSRAEEVLKSKLKPVAQDADFKPASSPPDIAKALDSAPADSNQAPPPVAERTAWDDMLDLAKTNGIHWKKAAAWLKENRQKATPKSVTAEDVEAYKAVLAAEPMPAPEDQPF